MEVKSKAELSVGKLLLLTFIPAILIVLLYALLVTLCATVIPPVLSILLAIVLVLIPFELGVILYISKKEYGSFSLKSAFIFNNKLPVMKLLLYAIIPFIIGGLAFMVIQPFENRILLDTVFKFVPKQYLLADFINQIGNYPKATIIITLILYLLLNGFAGPIVEELYFRGYIMPRLSRFKGFAPIITAVLFSLYHLFSPWENVTRIVAVTPYHYVVWKKKNIYIGMIVHCSLNLVSSFMLISTVVGLLK